MPGLSDAHWHAFMAATPQMVLMIKLIEDPAKNFIVIMKDGKIYKDLSVGMGK